MKPFFLIFAASLFSAGLTLAVDPADARRGRDHAEDGAHRSGNGHHSQGRNHAEDRGRHHVGRHRHCRWTWRDHRRVRVCRWARHR